MLRVFCLYLEAFRKGVFDYIKEEAPVSGMDAVPRRHFSGGISPDLAQALERVPFDGNALVVPASSAAGRIAVRMDPVQEERPGAQDDWLGGLRLRLLPLDAHQVNILVEALPLDGEQEHDEEVIRFLSKHVSWRNLGAFFMVPVDAGVSSREGLLGLKAVILGIVPVQDPLPVFGLSDG